MKHLKTILALIVIVGFSFASNSYATSTMELNKKLEEVVKFEDGALALEKNKPDFVKVSFRINEEGKLEILSLNYSDEKIKEQLMSKLSKITIEDNQDLKKIYN